MPRKVRVGPCILPSIVPVSILTWSPCSCAAQANAHASVASAATSLQTAAIARPPKNEKYLKEYLQLACRTSSFTWPSPTPDSPGDRTPACAGRLYESRHALLKMLPACVAHRRPANPRNVRLATRLACAEYFPDLDIAAARRAPVQRLRTIFHRDPRCAAHLPVHRERKTPWLSLPFPNAQTPDACPGFQWWHVFSRPRRRPRDKKCSQSDARK